MLADVIDYGEVRFGSRNESIVASFQTLLVKTASAVSGWLIGVGLTIVGYVPNITQTSGTILGMRILMIAVPSIITILGFFIYAKGYKLHGEYQEKIMEELNKKREANEYAV
ncbi:MFS transporter [uncultured Clostridium sp.]|nr:MFS transporter [uncultured Clostridium sp.]